MTVALITAVVFAVGFVGGVLNALIAHKGLRLPRKQKLKDGQEIWDPGWIGNAVTGGLAAVVLWGLYGPMAKAPVISDGVTGDPILAYIDVSGIVGALLTGVGGARIINDQVEKLALKAMQEDLGRALDDIVKPEDKDGKGEHQ